MNHRDSQIQNCGASTSVAASSPLKRKLRIGVLTFHNGPNFGAYFQALATQEALSTLGADSFIVDYINPKHHTAEMRYLFHRAPAWKMPGTILRRWIPGWRKLQKFKAAHGEFRKIPAESLKNSSLQAVIYGSDEIWNYQNPLFDEDLTFFGAGVRASKIAYAPSFGAVDLAQADRTGIWPLLREFSSLSVRDHFSRDVIEAKLGIKPAIVLDPTFLIGYDKYVRKAKIQIPKKEFIVVYGDITDQSLITKALELSRASGRPLISVGYRNPWCEQSLTSIGPFEFLALIKSASLVITTMFHGVHFSIHFKREFVAFSTPYRANKFSHLRKCAALNERFASSVDDIDRLAVQRTRWDEIATFLEPATTASWDYLKRALAKVT